MQHFSIDIYQHCAILCDMIMAKKVFKNGPQVITTLDGVRKWGSALPIGKCGRLVAATIDDDGACYFTVDFGNGGDGGWAIERFAIAGSSSLCFGYDRRCGNAFEAEMVLSALFGEWE